MVAKADIEAREAECSSAEDYAKLAIEALADPADNEYAKHLLQQSEMQCQFPADFVATAGVYANQLADKEYTADLLEQAADACFDSMENATVGNAYAALLDDKTRAAELFQEAADDLSDPANILTVAGWAQDNLGDADLAASLYAKVEDGCKTLDDFSDLAKKLTDAGNIDSAKAMYKKGERFIDGMQETVNFAMGAKDMFDDAGWAKSILEEAETDAQFPKEFVALAEGFKTLTGDEAKIDELLEQGADFAMTGEEHMELAQGYWSLKADKGKAAASYGQALADISDRAQLMELGKQIAIEMENPDLGKKFYSKAEDRITNPGDLTKLAETVFDDLGDKDYAKEIYARAEEQMVGAHDLIGLAAAIVGKLGDTKHAASVYQKALGKSDDVGAIEKLLVATQSTLADNKDLTREILEKMQETAEDVSELIKTQNHMRTILDDSDLANTALTMAEEKITSLNEMKAVAEAVAANNPDNKEWNARLAEKLEKREVNQALYDTYQKKENQCTRSNHFLTLGTEVVEKLDDVFYGRKLFSVAENLLETEQFNLANTGQLLTAVDTYIKDNDWVKELINAAAGRIMHFSETNQRVKLSSQLNDKKLAASQGKALLEAAAEKAQAEDGISGLIKVAQSASSVLNDNDWAAELLTTATDKAQTAFDFSALGKLALDLGDNEKAQDLQKAAANKAETPAKLKAIADRMRSWGMSSDEITAVYNTGESLFTDAGDKLEWAKNLATTLGDNALARSAMESIQPMFSEENAKKVFDATMASLKRSDYTRPHRINE
jgi:hypothetical protein